MGPAEDAGVSDPAAILELGRLADERIIGFACCPWKVLEIFKKLILELCSNELRGPRVHVCTARASV